MGNSEKKIPDSRPAYIAPQVVRLNDVSSGIGGNCNTGGSPTAGSCIPTGNGPGLITCVNGNGAKGSCAPSGSGVK